jgi:hypothetical protein
VAQNKPRHNGPKTSTCIYYIIHGDVTHQLREGWGEGERGDHISKDETI